MGFVHAPKDLTDVKNKVFLNLTRRQLVCFGLGAGIGIPFYILTRGALGSSNAAFLMVLIMLPFFIFAMYEKDGMPAEKYLMIIIRKKFIRPQIRPYESENFYGRIQQEIYDKEVLGIVDEEDGPEKSKARRN